VKDGGIPDSKMELYDEFEPISLFDNYIFIRKEFHSFWVVYVLVFRILSLKNPVLELNAFFRSRRVERAVPKSDEFKKQDFKPKYQIPDSVGVSVIIPTLNRYDYLFDVLRQLEKQTFKNFEVIIVDQSEPFKSEFYNQFELNIKLVRQNKPGLWKARNTGVLKAINDLVLFCEDDISIENDWIDQHRTCLAIFDADISSGMFYPENEKRPKKDEIYRIAYQFSSANSMVRRKVFEKIGLFDLQFEGKRMGDGEFGLRAYQEGFNSIFNPFASCLDLKASKGGLREFGSWDSLRSKSLFAPKPNPSVLYLIRKYFGKYNALFYVCKTIPFNLTSYNLKRNPYARLWSLFKFILFFPFWFTLILKSWRLSTTMVQDGDKIQFI
jgi:glycosyltransferase involved in cell wall biosynthesis